MCQLQAPHHTTSSHFLLEGSSHKWSNRTEVLPSIHLKKKFKKEEKKRERVGGKNSLTAFFFMATKYFQKTACGIPTLNVTKINENYDAKMPCVLGKFQLDSCDGFLILETGEQSWLQRTVMMNGWGTVNTIRENTNSTAVFHKETINPCIAVFLF